MLAWPGSADLRNIGILPVAVDVHVRRITEYLGVTNTQGQDLERVRGEIQEAWRRAVETDGTAGPPKPHRKPRSAGLRGGLLEPGPFDMVTPPVDRIVAQGQGCA